MINLLDILRKINPIQAQATPPFMPGQFNPQFDPLNTPDMTSMEPFAPRMGAFNQMQNMVGAMPQRDSNPSLMRKIGASIVGMGAGLKPLDVVGGQPIGAQFNPEASNLATDQFLQNKYYKEMADWGAQFKAMEPLVRAESDINQQNRLLYDANLDRKLRERTIERQEARDKDIYEREQKQLEINRKNAETKEMTGKAYAMKAALPNYGVATDKQGRLVFYNKANPKDIVQTMIETGKLSDEDRINMQLEGALEQIQARHEASLGEIKTRAEEQRETERVRPVRPGASTSPNAIEMGKARAIVNRANEAKRTHPEWSEWIKVDGQNVSVVPPSTGGIFSRRGPTKQMHKDINTFLSGTPPPKASETKVLETNVSATGKVTVRRKSDGKPGEMSRASYEAHKSKYDLVR